MKNIAFIINPVAGTQHKRRIPKQIEKLLDKQQWAYDIVFTEYKGHATKLALQYAALGFDGVVAVGGDGTVNEVASGLRGTNTALGIIPIGSGNGLARHLDISTLSTRAIEMLNHAEPITADYGMLDEQPFFCTCGTGFDALISQKYAENGKHGLKAYIEQIIKELFHYEPKHYHIKTDDAEFDTDAFLITVANANQWGNAAYIAPQASLQDGKLDITILSKFPFVAIPDLAFKLFVKRIDDSLYVNSIRAINIQISCNEQFSLHYDGEPDAERNNTHIRIVPDSIKLLVEKRF